MKMSKEGRVDDPPQPQIPSSHPRTESNWFQIRIITCFNPTHDPFITHHHDRG